MPTSTRAKSNLISPTGPQKPVVRDPFKERVEELTQAEELKLCKETQDAAGAIYFISHYVYIYETWDDFEKGFKLFDLWPRQIECVQFIEKAYRDSYREIVIEKCRRMGVSLLVAAALGVYHWLFTQDWSMLMGTLTENKIKLMPGHDTLFAKIRDTLENLPVWMLPEGFELARHLTSMNLYNPQNKNTITGELLTENFGRGPRATWVFRDEAAFPLIDTTENTAQTAQLNIDASTVNGLNFFDDLGKAAQSYEPSHLFVFDYWDNPDYTRERFEAEEARARLKGPKAYAKFRQEMLRDKRAIGEGIIYPNIEKCVYGDFDYNPTFPLYTMWDYGWGDMGYLGFIQRDPETGDLFLIDEVYHSHLAIEWYVSFVPHKTLVNNPYHYLPEELEQIENHKSWKPVTAHYGDPSGNQRNAATGKSVFDMLKPHRIYPRCGAGWQNMATRQSKTSLALLRLHINENRCKYFIDSFTQFRFPKRGENSEATTPQNKGVHKWSHAPSAFEAFCISEPALVSPEEEAQRLRAEAGANSDPWAVAR
jgi:hypothetical protein